MSLRNVLNALKPSPETTRKFSKAVEQVVENVRPMNVVYGSSAASTEKLLNSEPELKSEPNSPTTKDAPGKLSQMFKAVRVYPMNVVYGNSAVPSIETSSPSEEPKATTSTSEPQKTPKSSFLPRNSIYEGFPEVSTTPQESQSNTKRP